MFNKKIIIGLILLLFLTCGVASAFDLFGDNLPYEDIGIDNFFTTTEFSNDSFVKDDGTIYYMYSYSAFYFTDFYPKLPLISMSLVCYSSSFLR